jgi:hypothetical protein
MTISSGSRFDPSPTSYCAVPFTEIRKDEINRASLVNIYKRPAYQVHDGVSSYNFILYQTLMLMI